MKNEMLKDRGGFGGRILELIFIYGSSAVKNQWHAIYFGFPLTMEESEYTASDFANVDALAIMPNVR